MPIANILALEMPSTDIVGALGACAGLCCADAGNGTSAANTSTTASIRLRIWLSPRRPGL